MPQDRIKDYTGGLMGGTPSPSPGVKDYTGGLIQDSSTPTEPQGLMGNALSTISPVLDFLSRGQYASAGFFDALINDDSSIGDALSLAASELISPTRRRSFEDVIRRANPDFAANNPMAVKILGTLGDIALDPTTYVGLGLGAATKGARIGGRGLTTLGETMQAAAREALTGKDFAIGLASIPGKNLRPGDLVEALFPAYKYTREKKAADFLTKEAKARLPKEVARRASGEAGYVLEPLGVARRAPKPGEAVKNLEVIEEVFDRAFKGRPPPDIKYADIRHLASNISLERLGARDVTEAVMFVKRPLSEVEVVDAADRLISRLASEFPKLDREMFKPKGLRLQVGVPFTPLQTEIPLITTDMLRAVGLDRLDGLMKLVAKLPVVKQAVNAGKIVRGAFDRFYNVDERYVEEIIKPFENERSFVAAQVIKDADELLKTFDLDKEARDRVSRVMNAFDSGIDALPEELERRQAFVPEVFQAALRQAPLKPKEQALVMSLIDGYRRAAELERAAYLVGQSAANFDPRIYQAISAHNNPNQAAEWVRRNHPDGSVDVEGLKDLPLLKNATDIAAAIREGANLDQDAVLLYAARLMKARMALPKRQAEGSLRAIYGTADLEKLKEIAPKLAADWRYFGKMDFPQFRTEEANEVLNFFDNIQRLWKGSKTILNPGFALKQIVQNSFQSALALQGG
jgi:hypothetical protein